MDIKSHPFFKEVEPKRLDSIQGTTTIEEYEAGAVIFEEGSSAKSLYLILEGVVSFQKRLPTNDWLTVSQGKEGEYFGEIGVLTGDPRALQAIAETDCKLAIVPDSVLMEFLTNMPGPMEHLLKSVIKHLHGTTQQYIDDRLRREKMAVVGSMTNTIIHDFKNPFCLISLSSQLLRQKYPEPEAQKLCNNIEKQVDRMVAMTTELSEFSRGEQEVIKSKINLSELFEEFKNLNFPYFDSENIHLNMSCPSVELLGSKQKLFRVLQNLIGNAIDAFGDEEGSITVGGEIDRKSKVIIITIEDNAGGIHPSIRDKFFEPFVTYGKNEGTGLGTAIAKSIIEAHEGNIDVVSEWGKGTRFKISLPIL